MPQKHMLQSQVKTYHCQRQCIEAWYWPSDHAKRGKKISPSFFSCLDWLCTALLTGRLSDVLEMALLWALLTVTVTL